MVDSELVELQSHSKYSCANNHVKLLLKMRTIAVAF